MPDHTLVLENERTKVRVPAHHFSQLRECGDMQYPVPLYTRDFDIDFLSQRAVMLEEYFRNRSLLKRNKNPADTRIPWWKTYICRILHDTQPSSTLGQIFAAAMDFLTILSRIQVFCCHAVVLCFSMRRLFVAQLLFWLLGELVPLPHWWMLS